MTQELIQRAPRIRRRTVLLGVAVVTAAAIGSARWYNIGGKIADGALAVEEAHRRAASGDVLLVDIRRPDEWDRTGIPAGAAPLDMRRGDFAGALLALADGDRSRPIALICARGVRSRQMAGALAQAGFSNVVDVPEGMLGSGAGQGWLRKGLPVVRP